MTIKWLRTRLQLIIILLEKYEEFEAMKESNKKQAISELKKIDEILQTIQEKRNVIKNSSA